MAMGAALTWLSNGRLQATNRGQDHWRKVVDLQTRAIEEAPWVKPPPTASLATGPKGEREGHGVDVRGTLHVTLTSGSGRHELLPVAVPRDYSFDNLAWSPDGRWFMVQDGAARLLIITTGSHPSTRILIDGGTESANDQR